MTIRKTMTMMLAAGAAMTGLAGIAQAAVSTPEYLMKAGASDLYEITSSKLVMTSGNPKLKSFATMMVTDHNKSTAMVKAAALKSGIKPKPPMLTAKQKGDIAALHAVSGPARDSLYVEQQKAAHQEALALQKDYHMSGSAAPLKTVAGNIVPVVEHHIEMLSTM